MNRSPKLHPLIRFPVAGGLAYFAAWRLLLFFADDVGLLRSARGLPLLYLREYAIERILLSVVLVFPALYIADWLLQSRTQSILVSLIALLVALWVWT